MVQVDADRNLLFGFLALQMDFVSREALLAALGSWVSDKSRDLGQIFLGQGALSADRHTLLEALVREHLKAHGDDPRRSLAALSSVGPVRQDVEQIADPDFHASLAHLATDPPTSLDPHATRTPSTFDLYGTKVPSGLTPISPGVRFRILRPHAKGGLGQVYVARDEELGREVALKEIQDKHADHPESRSRFVREAEVTGALEHPGIVPVYGLGHYADGRPYYAMRFIRGDSLKDAIKRYHQTEDAARDPAERAIQLRQMLGRFVDVCDAMEYAHSRGVLHRDLKPDNIMLGKFGETLVVDWGLAKTAGTVDESSIGDAPPIRPASGSGSAETLPGSAMGTPAYMSPEQAAGRLDRLGPASDVYSLGATLYHLLTGHPPIEDRDLGIVLRKVQEGDIPPPRQVNPEVPLALEAIARKAMALEPSHRYKSPRALANDIEHWLADEPVSALSEGWSRRLARWARRHRTWAQAGAAALVIITLVSIAASLFVNESRKLAENRRKAAVISQNDAVAQRKEADKQRDEAITQKKLADAQSILARCQTARLFVDRGQSLCEQGNVSDGVVWLARGLRVAPDVKETPNNQEVAALQWTARTQLHAWVRPRHALQGLMEHQDPIVDMEFSLDGKVILTGGGDTARRWDAATGWPIGDPMGNKGEIDFVAFSPDNKVVLTGSKDFTDVFWDASTGLPIGEPMKVLSSKVFSPDGKVVLASGGNTSRLWDASTGRAIGLDGEVEVDFVVFSPDGKAVLTVNGITARLWDTSTGSAIGGPLSHDGKVDLVAISPDGKSVVTSSGITAWLWDVSTERRINIPLIHIGKIYSVMFSPNGKAVLTGSEDGAWRMWDVPTGRLIGSVLCHQRGASAKFSPDGMAVLTNGGFDGEAKLWDALTGEQIGPIMSQQGGINYVTFSPDGNAVLTHSRDSYVQLWNTWNGQPSGDPIYHPHTQSFVEFSRDGKTILTGRGDKTARLWEVSTGPPSCLLMVQDDLIKDAAFGTDSKTIITRGKGLYTRESGDTARVWDAKTGRLIGGPFQHDAVAVSHEGKAVLIRSKYNIAELWDAAIGRPIGRPMNHMGDIDRVAFSPDGKSVLTGGGNTTRLWDTSTGQPIGPFMSFPGGIGSVAISPGSKAVLMCSKDNTAELWDAATGRPIGKPINYQNPNLPVAFSPDGKSVLTGSGNTARLWDTSTGQPIGQALNSLDNVDVDRVAFSPDGKAVLTVNGITARLWDSSTGRAIGAPMIHEKRALFNRIFAVAFSPDSKVVLTGGSDNTARLWEASTGRPIGHPMDHPNDVDKVAFSPDGMAFLTVSQLTTRLWRFLPPLEGDGERLFFWVSLLTGKTLDDSSNGVETLGAKDWYQRRQRLEELGGPPSNFAITSQNDIARHRIQAEKYERDEQWFAAAWHLGRLIASEPANGSLYRRRANALAKLGRWKETIADYQKTSELEKPTSTIWNGLGDAYAELSRWDEADANYRKAIEANAEDSSGWLNRARLRLVLGDREGFRKACGDMLEHFASTEDPLKAHFVAWACALSPRAVADPAVPVSLAEKDARRNDRVHTCVYTLGATLYRSGRFEEAVKRLTEATEIDKNKGDAWNWLFLAMAQHRLGHTEEARNSLARAVERIDQLALEPPGQASALSKLPWHERMSLPILRREAEWLILESGFPDDPFQRP